MIKHLGDWAILEYERGEDYVATTSGFLVSSKRTQRAMLKGTKHTLSGDPDVELPDVVRIGTVVSASALKKGDKVLFNKHDGWGFEFNKQYLYAIKEANIMGMIVDSK